MLLSTTSLRVIPKLNSHLRGLMGISGVVSNTSTEVTWIYLSETLALKDSKSSLFLWYLQPKHQK
jgi:hypothetical protein